MSMSAGLRDGLKKRVERLRMLPSSPAVLHPLLDLLRLPPDRIDLKKVVQLVSYDKTIAAQCLRMANSALYAREKPTESIRAAVLTLGIQRVEDILLTCCLHEFSKGAELSGDSGVFWRHSLGCAAVANELAFRIGFPEPEKAYLAGLLHDLGVMVNMLAYPQEYAKVLRDAEIKGAPLTELEMQELGFTHAESGYLLGAMWQLPRAVNEVIAHHHDLRNAPEENPLVALVHIADELCRLRGLGHGYVEWRSVDLAADPAWEELGKACPALKSIDIARFTMDLDAYVPRVQALVDSVFASDVERTQAEAEN